MAAVSVRFRGRGVAAVLATALTAGLLQAPAAQAAKPGPYVPPAAKPVPAVPVKAVAAARPVATTPPNPASARPAPVWPKAGVADASLVQITPAAAARAAASPPDPVRVEVLDRSATNGAGVRGVLMRLAGAGRSKVTVNYREFATAYGADWSSRLRLVALPECALTTPGRAECAPTPLKSANDLRARTVSAQLPAGARTLVAATAAPSGPAGDYSASTLSPSSTWSAGGNTGAFTWSYEMRTPPSLGGPGPELSLSYSSQSVDGQHAASNNQPGWVGEGFETTAGGFIERRYVACAEDQDGSANNDKDTGDLCWETTARTTPPTGRTCRGTRPAPALRARTTSRRRSGAPSG